MAKKEAKEKETKEKEAPAPKPAPKKTAPVVKKPQKQESEDFRGIVRLAGKDMPGEMPLKRALVRIRGISHTMATSAAEVLHRELSLDPKMKVGELKDEQIEKIDAILMNLHDYKVLPFLLNRRKDYLVGSDKHDVMNDLLFSTTQDLERDKKMYTWKGYRHTYGQKVRGQRTRNTGRTGMAVGVLRKAIIAAQGGAAAGAKPGAAGAPAGGGAAAAASPAVKAAEKKPAAAEKK